jgi:hypothetical protein
MRTKCALLRPSSKVEPPVFGLPVVGTDFPNIINVRKRFRMLLHVANYFEFLFKSRSLLLALSALFREETPTPRSFDLDCSEAGRHDGAYTTRSGYSKTIL